jgi:hypothetical protein
MESIVNSTRKRIEIVGTLMINDAMVIIEFFGEKTAITIVKFVLFP